MWRHSNILTSFNEFLRLKVLWKSNNLIAYTMLVAQNYRSELLYLVWSLALSFLRLQNICENYASWKQFLHMFSVVIENLRFSSSFSLVSVQSNSQSLLVTKLHIQAAATIGSLSMTRMKWHLRTWMGPSPSPTVSWGRR